LLQQTKSVALTGQWAGYFTYGPEYGEEMHGEKVEFRIFIDESSDGLFEGKCVDIEGRGVDFEKSTVKGFIDGDVISFTKEYPAQHPQQHPQQLVYSGQFNNRIASFGGQWEIWLNERPHDKGLIVDIRTGTWEMRKDD
jgi:predicted HicB family RNase H-like nuclease